MAPTSNRYLVVLIMIVFVAYMGVAHALTDPAMRYILAEKNGPSAPESARCIGQNFCYGKKLTCPGNCKSRSTVAPGKSACFIDCELCKTSCRHRKVNCFGFGAVCYDPRFVGGDGVMFYFHGKKEQDYCMVSDTNLHINAHFIGKRPEGRSRDFTWVQALGILFDSHKLTVAAKKGLAIWSDTIDQFAFSYDGQEVIIPEHAGAVWTSPCGKVVIERTENANSVNLVIDQLLDVSLNVVPITTEESRVHNYQITDDDCFAHLQMQFNFFGLSNAVHGLLGQTYQPGFKNPVKVGVPMPIMGGEEKFSSSSLFSSDCMVSQFAAANTFGADSSTLRTSPVQCRNNNGGGLVCRR